MTPPEEITGDCGVTPPGLRDESSVDDRGGPSAIGIEGVRYERLTPHVDHRGSLREVVNFDQSFWSSPVVYSYCFTIKPGRIKGWGMHKRQEDRYFICSGDVRVALFDGRVTSPSHERPSEFYFTDASPGLLLIPPGVWHATQNWGRREAVLMNFPTRPYDRKDPDKYRIDPHAGEIPFDWTLADG